MTTWAIAGAAFTPDDARAETFKSTNGGRGVTLPPDLKVNALPVAGTSVRIVPGGATLPNRYLGADGGGQSYGTRTAGSTDLPIPETGAAAAVRYIIQRIEDPQYAGQVPANPLTHQYERFEVVASLTNLAYPYVELARIDQPANTATITQAMITDLRKLTRPRSLPMIKPRSFLGEPGWERTLTNATNDGQAFPAASLEFVDIPDWATHVQIRADWLSMLYPPGTGYGQNWIEFGPYLRENTHSYSTTRFSWDAATNADPYRVDWTAADEVPIPAAIRGTNQPFIFKGRVSGSSGLAKATNRSGTLLDLLFIEKI